MAETPNVLLLDVTVERSENPLTRRPTSVVVTVGHPPGEEPPKLADRIATRLREDGHDLRIEVRFVEVRHA